MEQYTDDVLPGVWSFLVSVFEGLDDINIGVDGNQLDHVCYRVATVERYGHLKEQLGGLGDLLTEADIAGRPISTFRLREPIRYGKREIFLVELPSPKPGSHYEEGWEHAEFALGSNYHRIVEARPDVPWNLKGADKPVNPEVSVRIGRYTVKFHEHPLDYVIAHLQ